MECPRIVQVGAGRFGRIHMRVLTELAKDGLCKLVGIVDSNKESLIDISIPKSTTINTFQGHFDAVDIVTPASTHYSLCKEILEQGKDVFVEKPMTTTFEKAHELSVLAQKNDLILMPGHNHRYNQAVIWLKDYINNFNLGTLLSLGGRYTHFLDPMPGVGAVLDLAIHHIDMYNYLLGENPSEVTCMSSYPLGRSEFEDSCLIDLVYGKIHASIEAGWLTPSKTRSLTAVGNRTSVVIDLNEQIVNLYKTHIDMEKRVKIKAEHLETVKLNPLEPLKEELNDFVSCVASRNPTQVTALDAVNILAVTDAALKSARERKPIQVTYHI